VVIDGDYIKSEAQAGRMTYCCMPCHEDSAGTLIPRATEKDLAALDAAKDEVTACLPRWHQNGIVPVSEIPAISNYDRGHRMYGINTWRTSSRHASYSLMRIR